MSESKGEYSKGFDVGYAAGRAEAVAEVVPVLDYLMEYACPHDEAEKELERVPTLTRSWCTCRNWVNRRDVNDFKRARALLAKLNAEGEK